jgi:hypothetical protein
MCSGEERREERAGTANHLGDTTTDHTTTTRNPTHMDDTMTKPYEPGTNVKAYGRDATIVSYDQLTDTYTVHMHVYAKCVDVPEVYEPTDPGVYKLHLMGGGNLIAQKCGKDLWILMGDSTEHKWPPVKNIIDWERVA